MGLVARVIEAAGIPTVTLNMIWPYQRAVGMPRVAAIEHPFGRPYGDVGDAETQRAVLRAALAVFEETVAPQKAALRITDPGDPSHHVLAGDVLSAEMTGKIARDIVDFIRRPVP